ncbi:MAG: DNA repair protein RecO [Geminicoccaceae bacterium]|nr:DNA repair protein RecO [Geminicoccaceae bacterium]
MEWRDEGILLSARPLGERDAVAAFLTFEHGRHAGLVRGGAGKRQGALLQPGNRLALTWSARLDQHLGAFALEPMRLHAATIMGDGEALLALGAATALVDIGSGERDPHPALYAALLKLIEALGPGRDWHETYVRFELVLLAELGFAVDLEACAVTGATDDLAFVSPRTGRAVSNAAAGDLAARLLPLPGFLVGQGEADEESIAQGLRLAGHFLNRHILQPMDKAMPTARERLVLRLTHTTKDDG